MDMESLFNLFSQRFQRIVIILSALLAAAFFLIVDIFLVQAIYREITFFKAESPSLGIPVWIYYAGVIACSPALFIGLYRGALQRNGANNKSIQETLSPDNNR